MDDEKPNHDKLLWRITYWRTGAIAAGCAAGMAWLVAWPLADLASAGWPVALSLTMILAATRGRVAELDLKIIKMEETQNEK